MVYDREHFLLKQKEAEMSHPSHDIANPEIHPELQSPQIEPNEYIENVLRLYRHDHADYRGRRNEDQQIIAEYAAEEADEYFDKAIFGLMAFANMAGQMMEPGKRASGFIKPSDEEESEYTLGNTNGGASLRDMRNAWRQLWVGWSVLTNRLHRDSDAFRDMNYPEVFEMDTFNKNKLLDAMFGNFQDLNALRFGAKGSGVRIHKWANDPDTMEPIKVIVDKDIARTEKGLAANAERRGYTVTRNEDALGAVHPAGKITPEEFVRLRKEFPEVDMDRFANDTAFYKDVGRQYRQAEDH